VSYDYKALVVFDHKGKFLHRIEKIGQGPGEYTRFWDFDVLPNGNIILLDSRRLLIYSETGSFINAIPIDFGGFSIKIIDENNFLICASGAEYSIYLVDRDGNILSKQLERNNKQVLGRNVAFFTLGNEQILYQQDYSNDLLSFNTKTKEFASLNLLCEAENIASIEKIREYENISEFRKNNATAKMIPGIASYADCLFFVVGNQSIGFKGYLMNTSNNKIDYLLTENIVDDISFTQTFTLLNYISTSDSDDCFLTYLYPYQMVEGLNENIQLNELPNYQYLQSLFKSVQNIEDENPVLIELWR
jgi:hypothetical protein